MGNMTKKVKGMGEGRLYILTKLTMRANGCMGKKKVMGYRLFQMVPYMRDISKMIFYTDKDN